MATTESLQNDELVLVRSKLASGRVYPEFFPLGSNDRVLNVGCGEAPQAIIYQGRYAQMVGIDVDATHLIRAREAMARYAIDDCEVLQANAEAVPLQDRSFDRAIAIDVLEHVEHPAIVCAEIRRLLKDDGEMLVTFPTMHDKYIEAVRLIKRVMRRPSRKVVPQSWDPDHHWNDYAPKEWLEMIRAAGFQLQRTRATTMFPPLHLAGVPKFWFSNNFVHRADRSVARVPLLKNYGQTLMCVFRKVELP